MSWLPKRDKFDRAGVGDRFCHGAGGKKKAEKVGGGGDAAAGTGRSVVLAHIAAEFKAE